MTRRTPKYWWKEMGYGFVLALGIIILIKLLPNALELQLWALTMTVILSIYIGFALNDGNLPMLILQIGVAVLFLTLTLLGLWQSPWYLVAALILHGFWDLLHDHKIVKTKVLRWYPDFCMVVDWVLGVFLAFELIAKS